MMRWPLILTLALLTACASGHKKPEIKSPYVERVQTLTQAGIEAMQRGSWSYAENVFARALTAAQLADDPALVTSAWYNLGVAHLSNGHRQEGIRALTQVEELAGRYHDRPNYLRAHLQLALLGQVAGPEQQAEPEASMPADIHLLAGKLAHRQGFVDLASREFGRVLAHRAETAPELLTQAQAHYGLAQVAKDVGNHDAAVDEAGKALAIARKVGAPRLDAHLLLFLADLDLAGSRRGDYLERSLVIYRALGDARGQRACLERLLAMARHRGAAAKVAGYEEALRKLEQSKE